MIYNKLRVKRTQIKKIIFLRLLLLHIKVGRSEDRKVAGVIIFSDPADHTNPGEEYPNGWMLNRYGVQRGTCLLYTSPSPRDATLSRMPSSA